MTVGLKLDVKKGKDGVVWIQGRRRIGHHLLRRLVNRANDIVFDREKDLHLKE